MRCTRKASNSARCGSATCSSARTSKAASKWASANGSAPASPDCTPWHRLRIEADQHSGVAAPPQVFEQTALTRADVEHGSSGKQVERVQRRPEHSGLQGVTGVRGLQDRAQKKSAEAPLNVLSELSFSCRSPATRFLSSRSSTILPRMKNVGAQWPVNRPSRCFSCLSRIFGAARLALEVVGGRYGDRNETQDIEDVGYFHRCSPLSAALALGEGHELGAQIAAWGDSGS